MTRRARLRRIPVVVRECERRRITRWYGRGAILRSVGYRGCDMRRRGVRARWKFKKSVNPPSMGGKSFSAHNRTRKGSVGVRLESGIHGGTKEREKGQRTSEVRICLCKRTETGVTQNGSGEVTPCGIVLYFFDLNGGGYILCSPSVSGSHDGRERRSAHDELTVASECASRRRRRSWLSLPWPRPPT